VDKYQKALLRRLEWIDEQVESVITNLGEKVQICSATKEEEFVKCSINMILFKLRFNILSENQIDTSYHKSARKFITERYENEIRGYYNNIKNNV
jgi:hypothetical protein